MSYCSCINSNSPAAQIEPLSFFQKPLTKAALFVIGFLCLATAAGLYYSGVGNTAVIGAAAVGALAILAGGVSLLYSGSKAPLWLTEEDIAKIIEIKEFEKKKKELPKDKREFVDLLIMNLKSPKIKQMEPCQIVQALPEQDPTAIAINEPTQSQKEKMIEVMTLVSVLEHHIRNYIKNASTPKQLVEKIQPMVSQATSQFKVEAVVDLLIEQNTSERKLPAKFNLRKVAKHLKWENEEQKKWAGKLYYRF